MPTAALTPRMTRRSLLLSTAAGGLALAGLGLPRAARAADHSYDLDVKFAEVDTAGLKLRTYNGESSGPLISAAPGESFQVKLTNSLPAQAAKDVCPETMNSFHGSNITNLHVHGLHVSPTVASNGEDSDNIFISLLPKGQEIPEGCHHDHEIREHINMYTFELPEDHPSGTFWYHAHKHGSTAQQVGNGLLGPLIVKDKPGVMPSYIENAGEDILLIQLRNLQKDTPAPGDSGGEPTLVLVNPEGGGTMNPVITMAPGEVRRWRIINGAPRADAFVSLNLVDDDGKQPLEVYQIAFDGITYEKRIEVDTSNNGAPWENPAALAPGNRTDFIVRVPKDTPTGELKLVALQFENSMPGMEMPKAVMSGGAPQPSNELSLTIKIAGAPVESEWSDDPTLPGGGPLTKPITEAEIVRERAFEFNLKFGPDIDTAFMINNMEFDNKVHAEFKLDTAERWQVSNRNTFTHPFHIHVNPFFVTHLYGEELAEDDPLRRWQDTMAIPTSSEDGAVTGSYTALSRFVRFDGAYVIHCHILEHEDEGMMMKVAAVT